MILRRTIHIIQKIGNMNNIKNFDEFPINEDYQDPSTFEDVPGIDVSLTNMRKKLRINIRSEEVNLTKEEALQIIDAIDKAIKRM